MPSGRCPEGFFQKKIIKQPNMASISVFPVPVFAFEVTFPSGVVSFQEVTGLDQENESLEYRSGDDPEYVTQKRAGLKKTGTISFKKGVFSGTTDLLDTYQPINEKSAYYSNQDPVDLIVNLNDESGSPVLTWNIVGAIPIKFTSPSLKSDDNSVAIEQLDFVHSGITLDHA